MHEQAKAGTHRLQIRDFEGAFSIFQVALGKARQGEDRKWEADFLFYLGLTRHQQAIAEAEAAQSDSLLSQAETYYRKALELRPDSGSIMNNLSQLYLRRGKHAEAENLLNRALALKGTRQAFYTQNYASLLVAQGNWKAAEDNYLLTLKSQPKNLDAHRGLVNLYLEFDRDRLAKYLWDLLDRGELLRAQDSALEALISPDWDAKDKQELLSIAVASLSKQYYDPSQFLETQTARSLSRFAGDAHIGEGIREIRRLHRASGLEPDRFTWWAGRGGIRHDPKRGLWPRDAFRSLIRTLGNWYQKQQRNETAEAYYVLSVRLFPGEVDPQASLLLADLYAGSGRLHALKKFLERYAPQLFYGKGEAYRTSQVERIYMYHRTLGIMYGYIGQWGNSGQPASAIFQLEHALELAPQIGVDVEPRVIELLATGYEKTNQPASSIRLRLDAARAYLAGNDPGSARVILAPVIKATGISMSAEDRVRFERLRRQLQTRLPPPFPK